MPFRPEFQKAGLAVTSKDQSRRIQSYITKAVAAGTEDTSAAVQKPVQQKPAKASQMDGFDDTELSDSPNTEISFARSNMDEWRYALIDEVPDKKKKKAAKGKKKRRCFPCLGASPSVTTDTEWAHFKRPTAAVPKFRKDIGPPPSVPPPPPPPTRPPRPAVGLYDPEPDVGQKSPDNQTTTSHMISPRRLPPRKMRTQSGIRSPIVRRNTPFTKDYAMNRRGSRRLSSKKDKVHAGRSSKSIPHAATSAQYKRPGQTLHSPSRPDTFKKDSTTSKLPENCGMEHDRDHIGICCRSHRGVPSRANARPNIPRRTSSMSRLVSSARLDYDDQEITDRDVLRGLHIAASAACDEEVDAFVRNRTGLRIRRFLADLMALETLGEIRPGEDREQWARRRRAEMRKLKQQIRRSREISTAGPFI